MYAKKYRLHLGGKRFRAETAMRAKNFSIKAAPSAGLHNRFTIIISKSAAKKATKRNFWKRIVADCIKNWPNSGKDFVIIALPKINGAAPEEIRKELREIGEKIK